MENKKIKNLSAENVKQDHSFVVWLKSNLTDFLKLEERGRKGIEAFSDYEREWLLRSEPSPEQIIVDFKSDHVIRWLMSKSIDHMESIRTVKKSFDLFKERSQVMIQHKLTKTTFQILQDFYIESLATILYRENLTFIQYLKENR